MDSRGERSRRCHQINAYGFEKRNDFVTETLPFKKDYRHIMGQTQETPSVELITVLLDSLSGITTVGNILMGLSRKVHGKAGKKKICNTPSSECMNIFHDQFGQHFLEQLDWESFGGDITT